MKKFALVYSQVRSKGKHPFVDAKLAKTYASFFDLAMEYGFRPVCVALDWFDGKAFTKAWTYTNGKWSLEKKRFKPDLVMDKTSFDYNAVETKQVLNQRFLVVNPWELDMIASDKLVTASHFPSISPETFLVRNNNDVQHAVKAISTKKIIFKPRVASGGDGIQILTRGKAKSFSPRVPMIVQPLLDTSKGVPGFSKTVHDFRIIFAGEKPILSYIRIPKKGSVLCNFAQGAHAEFVPLNKIPKSVKPIISTVTQHLRIFPHKIFSVDCVFRANRKPVLIELNTKPTMTLYYPEYAKHEKRLHHAYLKYFASLVH